MPQIGGVDISAAAVFDEALCVGFGEPFDLAQPEAEDTTRGRSVVRPSRRALRALLRMREVINATNNYLLILRRLRSSRLEGRTSGNAACHPFQGAVPVAEIDVGRAHLDAVLTRTADDLRRRVKPHRLRVEQGAGEDIGVKAFDPGRDIDEERKTRRVAFRKAVGAEALDLVEAAGREIMAVAVRHHAGDEFVAEQVDLAVALEGRHGAAHAL